jgi:hypothetical protein
MRRDNVSLLRAFEHRAKFGACMQVKASAFLGMRVEYQERHVVLIPREPPFSATPQQRIIHSQLLIFRNHMAAQPESKIWTDGASMLREGDTFLLKLHHSHSRPSNVRVEVDKAGLFCVSFRNSHHPGHAQQAERLTHIINTTLRASLGHLHTAAAHLAPAPAAAPAGASPGTTPPCAGAPSVPLAAPATAAAGASVGTAEYPAAPVAEPSASGGATAVTDEELAARLQQSELIKARMTDSDLQAAMHSMKPGNIPLAATPPVPPPPFGESASPSSVRSHCHRAKIALIRRSLASVPAGRGRSSIPHHPVAPPRRDARPWRLPSCFARWLWLPPDKALVQAAGCCC